MFIRPCWGRTVRPLQGRNLIFRVPFRRLHLRPLTFFLFGEQSAVFCFCALIDAWKLSCKRPQSKAHRG